MITQKTKKQYIKNSMNWIALSAAFGILYWTLESIRDVLTFNKGTFVDRLIHPDPPSFWMRILIVFILILFGTHIELLKQPAKRENTILHKQDDNIKILKTGLGFICLYWILESIRFFLTSSTQLSIGRFLIPEPIEFWIRVLAIMVFLLFSTYVQVTVIQQNHRENKLRNDGQRLQQIIQQMPYPICIFDTAGTIATINSAFIGKLGLNQKDSRICTYNIFDDPVIKKLGLSDDIQKLFHGRPLVIPEITIPLETLHRKKCDPVTIEATMFPVLKADKSIWQIVIICKDITARKNAEQEKDKMHSLLLQGKKMEAVGIFAGGIAHDFNNILTAIQGCSDLAIMELQQDNPAYNDLKQIQAAVKHATDLTSQLLLFSRKHPMQFRPLDLNQLINNLLHMLTRMIGEDIIVNTILAPDLLLIKADKVTIEQVLMNLAATARRAMLQGGKLTIATQNICFDKNSDDSFSSPHIPGQYVRLSVSDTGIGMDENTIKHIFEPFYSTKGQGKGTGLGLSVVYGIIQQHKGWIEVTSTKNKGTAFTITFPSVTSVSEKEIVKIEQEKILQGNGERLLIVEDDVNVRHLTARALDKNGFKVFSAADATEAMELFKKENGNFRLALCDIVLPGKTGIELADDLVSQNPGLQIVLGSGYMDTTTQWPIIKKKGFQFIQKPYILSDLIQTVKEMMVIQ